MAAFQAPVLLGTVTDVAGLFMGRDGTLHVAVPGTDYVVPGDLSLYLLASANLSDLTDPTSARSHLGLGSAAVREAATGSGALLSSVDSNTPSNMTGFVKSDGGKLFGAGTIGVDEVVGLSSALNSKEIAANKNQPNGYAGLDGSGVIPVSLVPNLVRRYVQSSPSASWVVAHGLNHRPQVQVFDASGNQVFSDVTVDLTNISVAFATPQTGSLIYQ